MTRAGGVSNTKGNSDETRGVKNRMDGPAQAWVRKAGGTSKRDGRAAWLPPDGTARPVNAEGTRTRSSKPHERCPPEDCPMRDRTRVGRVGRTGDDDESSRGRCRARPRDHAGAEASAGDTGTMRTTREGEEGKRRWRRRTDRVAGSGHRGQTNGPGRSVKLVPMSAPVNRGSARGWLGDDAWRGPSESA